MTTEDIFSALFSPIRHYQREAMQAAADQWGEVGPLLIAHVLTQVAGLRDDPERFDDWMGSFYTLTLFGHLRDETAWPAILALCTLPPRVADDQLGDLATEDLGQILYRCCGPRLDECRALYANRGVSQWVRDAAYRALQYGAAEGRVPRTVLLDCVVDTLRSEPDPQCEDDYLLEQASYEFLAMHPVEYAELARAWVVDGVVFPQEVGEDLEDLLTDSPEHWAKLLQEWRQELARYEPADLHARLSWWAAFEENQGERGRSAPAAGGSGEGVVKRITASQAVKRAKKNKMANKSRKANRKKK